MGNSTITIKEAEKIIFKYLKDHEVIENVYRGLAKCMVTYLKLDDLASNRLDDDETLKLGLNIRSNASNIRKIIRGECLNGIKLIEED